MSTRQLTGSPRLSVRDRLLAFIALLAGRLARPTPPGRRPRSFCEFHRRSYATAEQPDRSTGPRPRGDATQAAQRGRETREERGSRYLQATSSLSAATLATGDSASESTSATELTRWISISPRTDPGTSSRSGSLRRGRMTSLR